MKFYLASRYSRAPQMREVRADLESLGHVVLSRWIDGGHELTREGSTEAAHMERIRFAQEDWFDLMAADWVVSFTEEPRKSIYRRFPGPEVTEEWCPVEGSRLGYSVSNFGRVKNADGDLLAGKKTRGYVRVAPDGRAGPCVHVHSLVAAAFIGPCPVGHEIDHCDTDRSNNWVGNLEYVTHAENIRRAIPQMTGGVHAGERNGRAKLTHGDVAEIRVRFRIGDTKTEIARDYEVTDVLIGKIVRGELWPVNEDPSGRGGRHCEFGAALAAGKTCLTVGPFENVFHCLPQVRQFNEWLGALDFIREEAKQR